MLPRWINVLIARIGAVKVGVGRARSCLHIHSSSRTRYRVGALEDRATPGVRTKRCHASIVSSYGPGNTLLWRVPRVNPMSEFELERPSVA